MSTPKTPRTSKTPKIGRRRVVQIAAAAAMSACLVRPRNANAMETAKDEPAGKPAATPAPVEAPDTTPLPYVNQLGLQLYTVRDQMTDNPATTLEAIAEAGYWQVELMNIDEDAVRLAGIARDVGLAVHSAFLDFNIITAPERDGVDSLARTLDIAQRIGLRHVVFGYIAKDQRDTADKCRAIAESANAAANKTRAAGMRMCYHNHSFEFQPFAIDKAIEKAAAEAAAKDPAKDAAKDAKPLTAYDIFMERFDPQQMEFELDVFWAKIAGHDPLAMMRRLAGRISQIHLKDMLAGTPIITDESDVPKDAFQELGDGVIDIPAVMKLAKEIGVDQCHVEQDQSPAPLESIVQSIQFLATK